MQNIDGALQKTRREASTAFAEAERELLAALDEAEGFDAGDPRLDATLDGLVHLYLASGRFAEAERLCKRALAVKEMAWGAGSPRLASTLCDLASIHRSLGRLEDAGRCRDRALALLEAELGPEFAELAESLAKAPIFRKGPDERTR